MTSLTPHQATDVDTCPQDGPWATEVAAWLISHADSPNTLAAYRVDERQWRAWCAASGIDPFIVRRIHCDAYRVHLAASGGHRGRPAAPKTVARKLASLASLYAYLVETDVLEHSPLTHVKRPKTQRDYAATPSLDEKQLKRVLEAARDESPTAGAVCAFLALTGVRAREVLNADVTDLIADHGYRCLNIVRKGGHADRVTIPPDAATVLDRYVGGREDGPLFVTGGRRLTYSGLMWILERVRRASGLTDVKRLHPHMLRASYATISFDNGVGADRIQDALGHADPRTTRLYDRGRGKLKRMAEPGLVVAKHVMWDVEA